MRSAGAFSTATATLSLLGLPVVAIASKFAGVRQLLEANTALLAAAAAAAIACETLGGSEAVWAGAAELSTSGAAGGAAAASGVLWWAPHTTLLLLALGGTAGPVLLLALVPTLHLGFSLGHAYGELETLSVLGQACVCVCVHAPAHAYMRVHSHGRWLYVRSHARAWLQAGFTLLLGAARTGYGFKGALWALQLALLGGCVAARAYARASTEVAEDVRLLLAGGRVSHARADATQHGGGGAPPLAEYKLVTAHEDHTGILATSPSAEFSKYCLNRHVNLKCILTVECV